jgi:hypothetical protein
MEAFLSGIKAVEGGGWGVSYHRSELEAKLPVLGKYAFNLESACSLHERFVL